MLPGGAGKTAEPSAEERITQGDIDKLKSKLEGLDKALDEQEKELADMQQSMKKLEAATASYETLAKQYYDQIAEADADLERTAEAIRGYEQRLAAVEDERAALYDNYKMTLRSLRESRDVSLLELIFQAKSLEELLSSVERAKDLAEYKRQILVKMDGSFIELENEKAELETHFAEQTEYKEALEGLRQTVLDKISGTEKKLTEIAQQVLEAQQSIKNIEDSTAEMQKELTALIKRYEAQLEKERQEQEKARLAKQTLLWPLDYPTNRRCTSPYGYRYHPLYRTYRFHSGVDLAGPTSGEIMGDNIYAAMDGTVITAVKSRGTTGYGTYVIISHGYNERYKGTISTLYAHCDSISVKVGDKVKQGQIIGTVGNTGASTGPHLHFEVRMNGVTTDPLSYVYITKLGGTPVDPHTFVR